MDEDGRPTLDRPATVNAINFILHLREEGLIPGSTDYDTAETLFKEERVAAIINGPWSWSGYAQAGIDYGIARIPRMDETGLWCAPMTSSKGYSVNANLPDAKMPYVKDVLEYLTSPDMQMSMAVDLSTIPVIDSLRASDQLLANPVLQASLSQVEVSRAMPTQPQMRQYWDGMRGPYQEVMSGSVTPEAGARKMQVQVEKRIADTFL
jgi:maltose-binding protein MalE